MTFVHKYRWTGNHSPNCHIKKGQEKKIFGFIFDDLVPTEFENVNSRKILQLENKIQISFLGQHPVKENNFESSSFQSRKWACERQIFFLSFISQRFTSYWAFLFMFLSTTFWTFPFDHVTSANQYKHAYHLEMSTSNWFEGNRKSTTRIYFFRIFASLKG